MFVSTQNAHKTQVSIMQCLNCNRPLTYAYFAHAQLLAAAAIGVPASKILTRVRRLGMM